MAYISRTYRFEVLESSTFFMDPQPNRKIATLSTEEENKFEIDLAHELYEEFDGEIDINVNIKKRTIRMLNFKQTPLHQSWEMFAFRKKGISITCKNHIRLVEIM